MRVLLVTHEASRSGAPRVACLVVAELSRRGHDVSVVSRADGPLVADLEGLAPTRVEAMVRLRRRLGRAGAVGGFASWVLDTMTALWVIASSRCDLVYVNSTAAAVYVRPARWLRRRVLLHVHESADVFDGFLARARVSSLPVVVACSPSVADEIRSCGRRAESVHLIPSVPDSDTVVELASQQPPCVHAPDVQVVGCVGSAERRKGVDWWLTIAERVRSRAPEVRFVWVGDTSGEVPQQEGVDFLGPTPNPYAHISRFDVATLPSRDDPFPLVVIETMLLGTPMVAFDVGGVPEQLGDTGVLVPRGDTDAFADAVVELLADGDRRRALGAAAQARAVQRFSTSAFGDRIAEVVEGLEALPTRSGGGAPKQTPRSDKGRVTDLG